MERRIDVLKNRVANRQRSVFFVEPMHIGQNVPTIKSNEAGLKEFFLRVGAPRFELKRIVPEQSTVGIGLKKFAKKWALGDQAPGKFFANFRILGLAAKVSLEEPNAHEQCQQKPDHWQGALQTVGQGSKQATCGQKVDRPIGSCCDDRPEPTALVAKSQWKRASEMLVEKNHSSDLKRPAFLASATVIRVLEPFEQFDRFVVN
jgi:hypothetical protein